MDVFFSDFDGYSESSSSDDQEDDEFMYGGQASYLLTNLEETIGKIDDFLSFERHYVHGDVVRATKDPMEQMGRVINVEMVVDLENIHGDKLRDISSKKLQRIRTISAGDYVVAGPWVGRVEKTVDCVTVLFNDGTKSDIMTTGEVTLVPISPDFVDDLPYYPGQRVKVVDSSMSKSIGWFCGTPKGKQSEGIVSAVEAGLAHVNWLACAVIDSEKLPSPPSLQSSKDLTPLSCFSHSSWQLGDWCILPSNFQEIFVIMKTKSKVDVLWQDGSKSLGLDSNSLSPVNVVDAHDFWPHQFVLEKGVSDDEQREKWGVVKTVDAKEKTVMVKWGSSLKTEGTGVEETVSAYELIEHPDYSYGQGDLVVRLCRVQNIGDHEFHSDFFGSNAGIVIGFEDGTIEVKWAAGFTSKVVPNEIFRVEKSENVLPTLLLNDENLEPNHEKSQGQKEKDLMDFEGDEKACLDSLYDSTPFKVPRAAIGFLSSVVGRLFGSQAYTSLPATTSEHVLGNGSQSDSDKGDSPVPVKTYTELKIEMEKSEEVPFSYMTENSEEIRQFDMVTDCSNHHFFPAAGNGSTQVKRGWLKKIQQEWNLLAKDLPETIFVRVYEERVNLLQAAIIGAPGTPYHDGLFFFDIFLPPEYPHEPPMVHYNSGGLRVNPNLYESGKICLSLLNTWTGTGTETWNPEVSTVLQVLLSLQALVLNQKPYFNEAGYDQQVGSTEGEKNSCSYNENAFLMNIKSMLYVLRKPPKHFETLVEDHFRKSCKHILMTCKAYLEGAPIECEAVVSQTEKSTGFKIMLSKLIPKLVEAFIERGFDCGEYSEFET